jgi:hypothetical protein
VACRRRHCWRGACAECDHEQGHRIDRADAPPDDEPCEVEGCKCPRFVPSCREVEYGRADDRVSH